MVVNPDSQPKPKVVFGSLQANQSVYFNEQSSSFYSTTGSGVWQPPPSFTVSQAKELANKGGGTISTGNERWQIQPSAEFKEQNKDTITPKLNVGESGYYVKSSSGTYVPISSGVANLIISNNAQANINTQSFNQYVPIAPINLITTPVAHTEFDYSRFQQLNITRNVNASEFKSGIIDYAVENKFREMALDLSWEKNPMAMLQYTILYNPFGLKESMAATTKLLSGGTKQEAIRAAGDVKVQFFKEAYYNPNEFIGGAALSGAFYGMAGTGIMLPQAAQVADILFKGGLILGSYEFAKEPTIETGLPLLVGAGIYSLVGLASGFGWQDIKMTDIRAGEGGTSFTLPKVTIGVGEGMAEAIKSQQLTFFGKDLPISRTLYSNTFTHFGLMDVKNVGLNILGEQNIGIIRTNVLNRWNFYNYNFPTQFTETLGFMNKIEGTPYKMVYGVTKSYTFMDDDFFFNKFGFKVISRTDITDIETEHPMKFRGFDYAKSYVDTVYSGRIYENIGKDWLQVANVKGVRDFLNYHPSFTSISGGGGSTILIKPPAESFAGTGLGSTVSFFKWGEKSNIVAAEENIARTAAITSTSMWKPFNQKPKFKYVEETAYGAYPTMTNIITSTKQHLNIAQLIGTNQKLEVLQLQKQNQLQSLSQFEQLGLNQTIGVRQDLRLNQNLRVSQQLGLRQVQAMAQVLGTEMQTELKLNNFLNIRYNTPPLKLKTDIFYEEEKDFFNISRHKKEVFSLGKEFKHGKERIRIEPKSDWLSRIQSGMMYGKATNIPNKPKYKKAFMKEFQSPMGLFAGRMPTIEQIKYQRIKI